MRTRMGVPGSIPGTRDIRTHIATNNQHPFPKVFPASGNAWPHPSQCRYSGNGCRPQQSLLGNATTD